VDGIHENYVRGIELWKMSMAERRKYREEGHWNLVVATSIELEFGTEHLIVS
jgi:hypothetical protein